MNSIRKILLTAVGVLGFAQVANSQSLDLNSPLPFDAKVRTGKLSNGLQYFIRQNDKPEHRADFRLVVKAGSVLEDDDQQGLAHFNEHMAFNGTTHFPGTALPGFLESHGVRFGAHVNAYTSFDETVYRFTLPTDKPHVVDTGIFILGDWAHNVVFDPKEIDKERGVVGEEWRLGLGANERIQSKEIPVILKNSQYAKRIVIGQKAILDTAHYEAVQRFYKDWYRPDMMSVIVVGDVDPASIETMIKQTFGGLSNPAHERTRTLFDIPPHTEPVVAINSDKELTTPMFSYDFMRPETKEVTVADYVHSLRGRLYDQMLNERLQELTTQSSNPPFVYAYAGDENFLGNVQSYSVGAGLKPDSLMAGIRAIMTEVYRVKQHGFTEGELDRARADMMSSIQKIYNERDKTQSDSYASEYVRYVLKGEAAPGLPFEYELYKKYLPTITLSEVNSLTAERMNNASPAIALALPETAGLKVPTQEELLALLSNISSSDIKAYEDKAVASSLITTKPKAGKVIKETSLPELGVTEWTLSNGARVVLKPTDFKEDEILFAAQAPGGSSLAPDNDFYSANFASSVVSMSGVSDFSMTDLQKMLSGKEVRVFPSVSQLQEGLSGQSTKKDLETMFQLAYLYSSQPRLDNTAAQSMLSRVAASLKNKGNDPRSVFNDTVQVTMSQYHPRALPLTEESLNKIKLNDALSFYKARFADAGSFTYFLVGSFDPKAVKPLVEEYLASLPSSNSHQQWKDLGIEPPKGVVKKIVYKGMDPKASVRLTYTGPFTWSAENRYDLQAMSEALQIKLREDLREDKSGVYGIGVSASPVKVPKPRYSLTIQFGCAPDRVDELVGEVMKQIDTLTSQPMPQTYVQKVQETEKRELETSMKENNFWLSALTSYNWNGDDPNLILKRKDLISGLNAATIMSTARQYFNNNNYVLMELLPEKKN